MQSDNTYQGKTIRNDLGKSICFRVCSYLDIRLCPVSTAPHKKREKQAEKAGRTSFMKTVESGSHLLRRSMFKSLGWLVLSIGLVTLSAPLLVNSLLNP